MPVRCLGCGATFDLWHDLLAQGEENIAEVARDGLGEREHFCWRCRKISSEVKRDDINESEVDELELELSWE